MEKVPTFNVRVMNGRVLVDPKPNPPGVRAEPALVAAGVSPAVEPGVSPRGRVVDGSERVENPGHGPGANLPRSTAGETPAATTR